MESKRPIVVDGNEAVAMVAHRLSEVIAIYPITPSSPMGESSDEWSAQGRTNIWGTVPTVIEMQSEGGAAGAVHGAIQAGALTTTFTSSQGLLLMIPNMYKIAGELSPVVIHVAARTLATHALSIFGDHSDVYACRATGFAMLASGSVQEAHDLAAIAHAATLETRIPFLHFFDGFRTSHEVHKMEPLQDDVLRALVDCSRVEEHRARALSPDRPVVRGTAHNPDTYFQAREAVNPFYQDAPDLVQGVMRRFAELAGRAYRLFDYVGHPEAERVIVMMGSGAEAAHELVSYLAKTGERVGLVKVRLYRPFAAEHLIAALPRTVKAVAVLDRSKEPGAPGEPLYLDVVTALHEARGNGAPDPRVVGGRYGLSSKEWNAGCVKTVLDEIARPRPRNRFSVGIVDDVTHSSLHVDPEFDIEPDDVFRGMFYGLGSDGTVGANKNSIKIIGETTQNDAQGYFVYDSKKAGAVTVSHLRFGPRPIRSTYLIRRANFVAAHQWNFVERIDIFEQAARGAVILLNSPFDARAVWDKLPREAQESIIEKGLKLYVIDAYRVAREAGLGRRINAVMQTCFFAISGILPREEAISRIKDAITKTYGRKGPEVVVQNHRAVDQTLAALEEVFIPERASSSHARPPLVAEEAPSFVKRVTATIMAGKGDLLPVSAFPPDGTWPMGTTKWEKRNLALEIPVWDTELCIQCGKCIVICPHAAIRAKVYPPAALGSAPATFKSTDFRAKTFKGDKYTIQVAPEDCTGCTLCVHICPAVKKSDPSVKALAMLPQPELREAERRNYAFFLDLPEPDAERLRADVKDAQFRTPLFEYSGACLGCGETPYIKLVTQLFGDRALIANATGCSSIYGANLPTAPYTTDACGRGPAWSNSLFEDNAEFGLGFRLAVDSARARARTLLKALAPRLPEKLVADLLAADPRDEAAIRAQRGRIAALRELLEPLGEPSARELRGLADFFVDKDIWIVGGDGWAYDIGYGGLDHVLSTGRDVNMLVLDTGVYSNTGGQASKATPLGATARFAMGGKEVPRKDIGLMAMAYGHVYVAQIAMGCNDGQAVRAIVEAESYRGPSLILAYSSCIAHGFEMENALDHQRMAVESGLWPLYRYDPRRAARGENPLSLDSKPPSMPFEKYAMSEGRFRSLHQQDPERARVLLSRAQAEVSARYELYRRLAAMPPSPGPTEAAAVREPSSSRQVP